MAAARRRPSALDDPVVSIVIPAFNEKNTIEEILRRVLETPIRKQVLVVDDRSTDGTRQILQAMKERQAEGAGSAAASDGGDSIPLADLQFFFQEKNQGKGAAVRRGFAQATGDIVLVQDADLEYDPRDYEKLLEPILDGRADVVYGSRFLGGPQRVNYFWHYVANKFLEVLAKIQIKSDRFGFEPEITAKIAKGKWRVYEVPITYAGRTYEEGKKITWKDGVQALWCILRFRLMD